MARYQFELARRDDDAQLRHILAATPMAGRVSVTFESEPSYFDAARVDGGFRQVVVCRDAETNRIVGFGCRSIRDRYVNGALRQIGYLSSLRALEPFRNLGLVARGYRFFRELHADRRTELYLTTIAEGNDRVTKILTSGRAGLPLYHFAGNYHTVAIPVAQRPASTAPQGDTQVRAATRDDLSDILAFFAREGPGRQFFPNYEAADFFHEGATFRDLRAADMFLAIQDERIVGTLANWDQQRFRQIVVNGYEAPLRWTRPLYNGWARLRGRPRLPQPGASFRYTTAAVPLVAGDDPRVFNMLLDAALTRLAEGAPDYLLIGLHERDPLLPIVTRRRCASYVTQLYFVCWQGEDRLRFELDGRAPYLELGAL